MTFFPFSSLLSALPQLARYTGGVLMAWAADRLLRKREDGSSAMSRTNVRRVFNSISQVNELSLLLLSAPNQQDSLIVLLFDAFEEPKLVVFHRIYKSVTLGDTLSVTMQLFQVALGLGTVKG